MAQLSFGPVAGIIDSASTRTIAGVSGNTLVSTKTTTFSNVTAHVATANLVSIANASADTGNLLLATAVTNQNVGAYFGNVASVPSGVIVNYLVVAGGGAGGGVPFGGGGGGAGGLLQGSTTFTPSTTYTISIGAGGSPGIPTAPAGGAGWSSNIFQGASALITTVGGGGGGGAGTPVAAAGPAGTGGSGGGGGSPGIPDIGAVATGSPGLGVAGTQGYPGGNGISTSYVDAGGGGGGAGASGTTGTFPGTQGAAAAGGPGGIGVIWPYTGPSIYYAGGGGGSLYTQYPAPPLSPGTVGAGGLGGGGTGGGLINAGGSAQTAGTVNTGGGGGGAEYFFPGPGGAGGSGVVLLAIPTPQLGTFSGATSSTPPSAPGQTVLTYTTSGTYTSATYANTGIITSTYSQVNYEKLTAGNLSSRYTKGNAVTLLSNASSDTGNLLLATAVTNQNVGAYFGNSASTTSSSLYGNTGIITSTYSQVNLEKILATNSGQRYSKGNAVTLLTSTSADTGNLLLATAVTTYNALPNLEKIPTTLANIGGVGSLSKANVISTSIDTGNLLLATATLAQGNTASYFANTFNTASNTTVANTIPVLYLVQAGGGGGGGAVGNGGQGGGGGGGQLIGSFNLTSGAVYTVAIGSGGAAPAQPAPTFTATPGFASNITINAPGSFGSILALGGGGGAAGGSGVSNNNGLSGGSGGGGGVGTIIGQAGLGTPGQGSPGGVLISNFSVYGGGGGGGAGTPGGAAGSPSNPSGGGSGGSGVFWTIGGSSQGYGGGGGGGVLSGVGGAAVAGSGGGAGGAGAVPGGSGIASTGGGGGGAGNNTAPGGNGGSGVVILAIPNAIGTAPTNLTGGTIVAPGTLAAQGFTVVQFATSGTYTAPAFASTVTAQLAPGQGGNTGFITSTYQIPVTSKFATTAATFHSGTANITTNMGISTDTGNLNVGSASNTYTVLKLENIATGLSNISGVGSLSKANVLSTSSDTGNLNVGTNYYYTNSPIYSNNAVQTNKLLTSYSNVIVHTDSTLLGNLTTKLGLADSSGNIYVATGTMTSNIGTYFGNTFVNANIPSGNTGIISSTFYLQNPGKLVNTFANVIVHTDSGLLGNLSSNLGIGMDTSNLLVAVANYQISGNTVITRNQTANIGGGGGGGGGGLTGKIESWT